MGQERIAAIKCHRSIRKFNGDRRSTKSAIVLARHVISVGYDLSREFIPAVCMCGSLVLALPIMVYLAG